MHLNRTTVLEPQQGSLDPFLSIKVCLELSKHLDKTFLDSRHKWLVFVLKSECNNNVICASEDPILGTYSYHINVVVTGDHV